MGLHYPLLDQPTAAAGNSVIALDLAICRAQCAYLRDRSAANRASTSSASMPAISRRCGERRVFYRLPYWHAEMKVKGRGSPEIEYRSKRSHGPRPAELRGSYRPVGKVGRAYPDTIEHFLTERYCLYAISGKRLYRADIHHLPWALQAAETALERNNMAVPAGIDLPAKPDLNTFRAPSKYSSGRPSDCGSRPSTSQNDTSHRPRRWLL